STAGGPTAITRKISGSLTGGSPPAVVNDYVIRQQQLGYAELHEWSRAVPTPNPGEVMRMLTKRVLLDR
ncbi:MAG: hypothetical protein F6K28_54640, partial [Microcoleus sp. SIO2G3]|nr:hypothetical protein [Microcoleus sp. SIO2G3]